jgi:hypothetical protein
VRVHTEILPALAEAGSDLRTLGDLGCEGESDIVTMAFKKPKHGKLSATQQQLNKVPQRLTGRLRAGATRG